MSSAIYVFSRDVRVSGRIYRQSVSVYAEGAAAAQQLLAEHLKSGETRTERAPVDIAAAYGQGDSWRAHTVQLDRPKIVSALLTH